MRAHALLRQLRCSASTSRRLRYEHGFHAGSYVDVRRAILRNYFERRSLTVHCSPQVTKHAILSLLMLRMAEKSSPFSYVDTHAGAGSYPLEDSMELSTGLDRLLAARLDGAALPPALSAFMRAVDACGAADAYPGSPLVAAALCRDDDALLLVEQSETEHAKLVDSLEAVRVPARTICGDGYRALQQKDNLAPQRRALVFVDPAYQQGADLERTVKLVEHLERAWHSARVAVWYPVRDTAKVDQLHDALRALPRVKEILAAELVRDEDDGGRLPGSGVVLVNPPYGIDAQLEELLSSLGELLSDGAATSSHRVSWVKR